MDTRELYDRDFFEWTARNAELLRDGRLAEADIERIAEEIEDVGKRDQREVRNRLKILLVHLLKWKLQPDKRFSESGNSNWRETIAEQRSELEAIFEQSPSLQRYGRESLQRIFVKAAESAAYETNLPRNCFPIDSPFSFEQILDLRFLPE